MTMSMERRSLILAATAPAAPALVRGAAAQQGTSPPAAAPASQQQQHAPGFCRFEVGGFTATVLHDGLARRPSPLQTGVRNADPAAVEVALRAALMPTTHFMNPFNVTAVDTGRGLVLFDTGNGRESGPEMGLLAANMRAAGLDPARVAQVVMTHFHPDHIGGLALNDGAAVFPNSEIVVGAREWAHWTDGGEESRAPEARRPLFANVRRRFAPYEGRVRRIEDGAEVAPGVRALATHGHTPGHLTYQVSDGADVLMVLGDLTNRPEFNLRHPGWHMAVDQDPQMAEATRRRMFDRVAAERARCVGYHWPFPANGHIVKEGDGYRLVPADWSSQV